jgi:hypothetical protein
MNVKSFINIYLRSRTRCNTIGNDTFEAVAYPINFTPGSPIRVYRNVACRFVELEYHGIKYVNDTIPVLAYKFRKDVYDINNATKCLCTRGICIKGISDLSPCFYSKLYLNYYSLFDRP